MDKEVRFGKTNIPFSNERELQQNAQIKGKDLITFAFSSNFRTYRFAHSDVLNETDLDI